MSLLGWKVGGGWFRYDRLLGAEDSFLDLLAKPLCGLSSVNTGSLQFCGREDRHVVAEWHDDLETDYERHGIRPNRGCWERLFYFFQDNNFYSLKVNQESLGAGDVALLVELLKSMLQSNPGVSS